MISYWRKQKKGKEKKFWYYLRVFRRERFWVYISIKFREDKMDNLKESSVSFPCVFLCLTPLFGRKKIYKFISLYFSHLRCFKIRSFHFFSVSLVGPKHNVSLLFVFFSLFFFVFAEISPSLIIFPLFSQRIFNFVPLRT